jgi:hypothetical protein
MFKIRLKVVILFLLFISLRFMEFLFPQEFLFNKGNIGGNNYDYLGKVSLSVKDIRGGFRLIFFNV